MSLIIKKNSVLRIFLDFWSNTPGNFWNVTKNPYKKTITNFNVKYTSGGVDVNWGEGINESVTSGTNINHTFGITKSGISIFSRSGANIKSISCGVSSPKLSGTINISSFPNLTGFTCFNNNITAFSGIESGTSLINLNLGYNSLRTFPSFNHTPLLQELRIENNLLSGSIPSLNNLTGLKLVRLQENKNVTGNLPSLSLLRNLESFYAIGCNLRGPIPNLSQNTLLEDFRIDSQTSSPKINGTIPSLSGNPALAFFYCHNNQLSGSIPSLSSNTILRDFRCYTNQLTGSIPSLSGLSELQIFQCQENQLTGFIPSFYLNFSPYNYYLQNFNCAENQLTGSIPQLNNFFSLTDFDCSNNRLTGSIPSIDPNNYVFYNFYCNNNQLTGPIPKLRHIINFDCSNNQLTGSIPDYENPESNYYPLFSFNCSNNRLSGALRSLYLPYNIEHFNCSNNKITGFIPSFTNQANYYPLKSFDCSNNLLIGSIPTLTGLLSSLVNFSCHSMPTLGGILPNLSGLNNLESFYCYDTEIEEVFCPPYTTTRFAVPSSLGDFRGYNNLFGSFQINAILAAFVAANRTTGTKILSLGANGAPTGQGITDKATLISRGWTVTTN
jgi:hypothetical protein